MPSKRELKQYADHFGIPFPEFLTVLNGFRSAFGPKGLPKMLDVAAKARGAGVDILAAWDDALSPEAVAESLKSVEVVPEPEEPVSPSLPSGDEEDSE